MTRQIVLGVDVGTSDTKVLATSLDGDEITCVSAPTEWSVGSHGWTDADGERLVDTVFALLDEAATAAAAAVGPVAVAGVAVTGMAEAGVLLDPHDRPAHPVIAWFDPRGGEQLAAFPPDLVADFPGRTGLPVNPLATVVKLAWMRSTGTELPGHCWLNIPEFVAYRLTGVRASEISLVARTGLFDHESADLWPEMLDYLGASADLVPTPLQAGTPLGRAGLGATAARVPAAVHGAVVAVAGHDHPVGAVGSGVIATDAVFDSLGTAEAFVRSTRSILDRETRARLATQGFNVVHHVLPGRRLLLAGTRGGLILRRTLRLLGVQTEQQRAALDVEACALSQSARAEDVVTVSGAANDDGVLSITTGADIGPAALWLAALDHTIDAAAKLLDIMDAEVGPATSSVVAGGWTRMASVRAAKTASLPSIRFSNRAQAGAFGAAAFAAHAVQVTTTDHPSDFPPGQPPGPGMEFLAQFTGTQFTGSHDPAPDPQSRYEDHQEVSA